MDFWDEARHDVVTDTPAGRRGGPRETDRGAAPVKERLGYGAAILVVVVLGALVGAGWWFAHHQADGHVARGTSVAGVDLGGTTRPQAVAALRAGLADREDAPITLDVGGRRVAVTPSAAGLGVDYQASVDRAVAGDTWNPTALWDFYTDRTDLLPVVTVDRTVLHRQSTALAGRFGRATEDAAVTFAHGRVVVARGRDGQGVDVDAVASALVHAYLSDASVATVPLTQVAPPVGDQAVRTAIDRLVNPALSAPVTLTFAGHDLRLPPSAYQDDLTLTPRDGRLVLGVDAARLVRLVRAATSQAPGPVDATVALVDGAPTVVPPRRGLTFAPATVARVFLSLLDRREAGRHAVVPAVVRPAAFTAADARALRIAEPVSTFTTRLDGGPRGQQGAAGAELARQAALVDGTVLRPGEVFSLKKVVRPTSSTDQTQLATTLYNAAFDAGLEDVAHTPPLQHVARYPLGREATVYRRGPDLGFRDDTPHGVLVSARVRAGALTVTLWSTRTWSVTAATSCERSPGSSAFEVVTSRIFRRPGATAVDHIQKLYTTYPTLPAAVCRTAGA